MQHSDVCTVPPERGSSLFLLLDDMSSVVAKQNTNKLKPVAQSVCGYINRLLEEQVREQATVFVLLFYVPRVVGRLCVVVGLAVARYMRVTLT